MYLYLLLLLVTAAAVSSMVGEMVVKVTPISI